MAINAKGAQVDFLSKRFWLSAAEIVDAFRVMPRVLLVAYCIFVWHITNWILAWYMALPAAERGLEAAGLCAGIFTAVTGLATVFLNVYLKSGRHWNGNSAE